MYSPAAGLALAAAGGLLVTSGWYGLIVYGRGLPMNAFPPSQFVRIGVYRWIRNPIYSGSTLICAGVSISTGSPSGLWLVTSTVAVVAAALVFGFERIDLVRRFGAAALEPPLLSIPRGDDVPPSATHRLAVFVWILSPWMFAWLAAQIVGRASDAFETALPFERRWAVWQWTELLYVSAYLFVPLTILLASSHRALRRLALSGGIATVLVTICWFVIPVVAANRSFTPSSVMGQLLAFEQRSSTGVAAFPAFHVLWAMLAAVVWSDDARHRQQPARAYVGWIWAGLITVSCLTTGMHSLLEVLAAVLLFLPLRDPARSWRWIHARVESLANSWREWRIGRLRVISHAAFAGCAAGVGFVVMASAVPSERLSDVMWITFCTLAGAGIWAQVFEGSSLLLRPFGWYGGVPGAVVGVTNSSSSAREATPLFAALALAAAWIQALGRLRCLVQGCCHGGLASEWPGIRYHHRRSRVTFIVNLARQPIHATPLYSIAVNIIIGVATLRLRFLGAADTMLVGIYLILTGVARFAEEGYRAEPQTAIIRGLHSYQWLAVASVLAGIWSTTIASATASVGFAPVSVPIVASSVAVAMITGAAMGVDLPQSSRRFSRLAPVD